MIKTIIVQTQISVLSKYADPAHDAYIHQLETELIAHAELQGQQNGEKNKPVAASEFFAFILNKIQTTIQSGIHVNHQMHTPVSGMVVANEIRNDADAQIQKIQAGIDDDGHKRLALENEAARLKPCFHLSPVRYLILVLLALIAISDGGLSYPGFRHMNMPVTAAIVAACGVAVAVGAGAHHLAGCIRMAKTRAQKLLRYAGVLALYFAGFFTIGYFRAQAYNHTPNINAGTLDVTIGPSYTASAIGIAFISFLLFWLGLFLSIRFWVSKEEQQQMLNYTEKCEEIQTLQKSIEAKEAKIAAVRAQKHTLISAALSRFEYAKASEARLIACAEKAVQAYIDKNLRFRSDCACPEFFAAPPRLAFTKFFDNLKKDD